jgi:hypothetical protein
MPSEPTTRQCELCGGDRYFWSLGEGGYVHCPDCSPAPRPAPAAEEGEAPIILSRAHVNVDAAEIERLRTALAAAERLHDDCATRDDVAREVICRVLDAEAIAEWAAWYAQHGDGWLWWGRALGAWLHCKLTVPLAAAEARAETAARERQAERDAEHRQWQTVWEQERRRAKAAEARLAARDAETAREIARVAQDDPKGCAVACLAMIAGRTYAEVRAAFPSAPLTEYGLSDHNVVRWLDREGIWHRRNAPELFTDGTAIALTTDSHWVVLHRGDVLDPAREVPLQGYRFAQVIEVLLPPPPAPPAGGPPDA